MAKTPKSSLGGTSRRGPLKAHIPYRGDNPEVGKKTGITVQHVERQSDGFEPFEAVLQQADGRTPPRPKKRRKSLSVAAHQDEDEYGDDGGEESMQLVSPSPIQKLTHVRPPVSSAKSHRSSIRPVARTSDIDFDKIPSPRLTTSSQRNGGPYPSSPLKPRRVIEPAPDSGSSDPADQDTGIHPDLFDDYAPQESRSPAVSPRRKSFSRIEQEEDDDDQQEEEEEPAQKRQSFKQVSPRRKSFGRIEQEEDDEDHQEEEEEPPQKSQSPHHQVSPRRKSFGRIEQEEDDDHDEQEEVEELPPRKKPPTKTKTQSKAKKENQEPREGVRRSQRERYKPLEYWRGEKLVYGRTTNSGPILVPQIKEIIRIPKEVPVPLRAKRKRGTSRARGRSNTVEAAEDGIPPALPVVDPEEGWDDNTEAKCIVINFTTKEEVTRRIAWTAKMVEPRLAVNHTWSFDKIFGDDNFIAAGQLIIPPKGRKPSKASKDNTYLFYVIEGAVNFKIHNTSMILATGGMFMVPRGNMYFIENICERDAKLFFTQARKMAMTQEELAARAETAAELQRRRSSIRSSSAGTSANARLVTPNGGAATVAA